METPKKAKRLNTTDNWDEVAEEFLRLRSETGTEVISRWMEILPASGLLLDVGCGSGIPVSKLLYEKGFKVFGVDSSPKLLKEFQRNLPNAPHCCESVQESKFFGKKFDGVVAVGLIFLLTPRQQSDLLSKIARSLKIQGRLLFSSPVQPCQWRDSLTGQCSQSLGKDEYIRICDEVGLDLVRTYCDEGQNHYYDMVKRSQGS